MRDRVSPTQLLSFLLALFDLARTEAGKSCGAVSNEPSLHTLVRHQYYFAALPEREVGQWRMGCKILDDGLPRQYAALEERIKRIIRQAEPRGEHAIELLKDFRAVESKFIDG